MPVAKTSRIHSYPLDSSRLAHTNVLPATRHREAQAFQNTAMANARHRAAKLRSSNLLVSRMAIDARDTIENFSEVHVTRISHGR